MKTNVIPDIVDIDVDIRTLPGEAHRRGRRPPRAPRSAISPTSVEVEVIMDDPASISRTDTPLWDALQRAVASAVPGRHA